MKLGAMQPYFFPYLGYFDLIHSVDRWIVADTMQYMRHGWVNRNRVLHPAGGWQYVVVPLRKHPLRTPIREIAIAAEQDWRTRLRRQLEHYRSRAPFYRPVMALLDEALAGADDSLCRLNVRGLAAVCGYLGLRFEPVYLSELKLPPEPVSEPGEWAIRIAQAVGAAEYVNPPGGAALYDPAAFARAGLKLTIKPLIDFRYECPPYEFIPALSILDVLMWNPPQRVKAYLDSVKEEAT